MNVLAMNYKKLVIAAFVASACSNSVYAADKPYTDLAIKLLTFQGKMTSNVIRGGVLAAGAYMGLNAVDGAIGYFVGSICHSTVAALATNWKPGAAVGREVSTNAALAFMSSRNIDSYAGMFCGGAASAISNKVNMTKFIFREEAIRKELGCAKDPNNTTLTRRRLVGRNHPPIDFFDQTSRTIDDYSHSIDAKMSYIKTHLLVAIDLQTKITKNKSDIKKSCTVFGSWTACQKARSTETGLLEFQTSTIDATARAAKEVYDLKTPFADQLRLLTQNDKCTPNNRSYITDHGEL